MAKRKALSASLRWSVFARDGFTCRYCGAQAGQDGVELHADHVLSVADGGTDTFDNLVTACQKCNGGKGARSIAVAPTAEHVFERLEATRDRLKRQAEILEEIRAAEAEIEQQIVNIKCDAYGVSSVTLAKNEVPVARRLMDEFGPAMVVAWYRAAACAEVRPYDVPRYLNGCARRTREAVAE